ncbi:MAG: bifunctional folylpolyglutamate synthase/dihydrofolate synthase [Oscillospiraceae bacterium]|nr:bifunctional folylpolyglutamate synthase/dihydrofolate synthase [Oscillospiraceae bacterium]
MTYDEALCFINSIPAFGKVPGRMETLLDMMGRPHERLRFIHVAGTSGKGSICAMLSHILCEAGYKTGLYISPYIVEFRERIQVSGEMIPQDDLTALVQWARPFYDEMSRRGLPVTMFELVAAMAFEHFRREQCDIAVLEVGMGGLYDSTNVIGTPLVSVIGSIGIDHSQYLGNTIGEIALHKCGIIKRGGVTVSYPRQRPEALAVIKGRCAEEGNPLLIPADAEIVKTGAHGSDIIWGGMPVHIPLAGGHQVLNALTALEAVRALGHTSMKVTKQNIADGMAKVKFPARFEIIGDSPAVILDSAHNFDKLRSLADTLPLLKSRKIHGVIAMMSDKTDVPASLGQILPLMESVTATTVPGWRRAFPPEKLAGICRTMHGKVHYRDTPEDAFAHAVSLCKDGDAVLVCGSMYIMTSLRPIALARVT